MAHSEQGIDREQLGAIRAVLEQVSNRWTVSILASLCGKPKRFNAIKRDIEGVTQKSLTEALRRMERSGVVSRRVIPTSPIGVEYALTPIGESLEEPFRALCRWSLMNQAHIKAAQAAFDKALP